MRDVSVSKLVGILFALPWDGHVELPDQDIVWLAGELHKALTARKQSQCESCGSFAVIIVPSPLGGICEDCIENLGDAADNIREALETTYEQQEDRRHGRN